MLLLGQQLAQATAFGVDARETKVKLLTLLDL